MTDEERRRYIEAVEGRQTAPEVRPDDLEYLRGLVRRLTRAYGLHGGCGAFDIRLYREATRCVDAMPPPPRDDPEAPR